MFGIIKSVLGFRQFSMRGLEKVRSEWSLVTMAWNIKRIFAVAPDAPQIEPDPEAPPKPEFVIVRSRDQDRPSLGALFSAQSPWPFGGLVLFGTRQVRLPKSGWTSSQPRALLGVRRRAAEPPFSAPRRPSGHRGVVLVTADAVASTGEEHGEAHRYPADRVVESGPTRGRGRMRSRPSEQGRRRKGRG
ncbi:protein of unknown function [Methylocella tundrae]|uniref:Transposase DDE domain-containing protein n=1 Tax=Methylocella tundrae TaxID=227605 RepID=A0A4U8Z0T1_METTU|nr:protein of unknown function [Methylocella tundrae]